MSCDRSLAFSKASSPQCEIWCFLVGFPVQPLSLTVISRCLRLLPYLLLPPIFPSIRFFFTMQSLRKMRQIQLAAHFIECRIFPPLTLYYTSSLYTDIPHPSPAPHFRTFMVLLIYFPKCPSFSTLQSYVRNVELPYFFH